MDQEKNFLDALSKNPENESTRAVYADYLEERGDVRGVWLNHRGLYPPGEATIEWLAQVNRFRPGEERINPKDGTVLVWVPPGVYPQGGNMYADERPQHTVELTGFWIGKYPVTNEQYGQFIQETEQRKPAYWDDPRFNQTKQPVVGVSWHDAVAYCQWAGLRLPTEAEWEAAARGPEGRTYPWGEEEPSEKLLNFAENVGATTPVGSYPAGAGPFGTLDQAGNVWEWCLDTYDYKAYGKRGERARDPVCLDPKAEKAASVEAVLGSIALTSCTQPSAAATTQLATPKDCALEQDNPKESTVADIGTSTSATVSAVCYATNARLEAVIPILGSAVEQADPKVASIEAAVGAATVSATRIASGFGTGITATISDSGEPADPKAALAAEAVGTTLTPRTCAARTVTGTTPTTTTSTADSAVELVDPKAVFVEVPVGTSTTQSSPADQPAAQSLQGYPVAASSASVFESEPPVDPKAERAASNAVPALCIASTYAASTVAGTRRVSSTTSSVFEGPDDPKESTAGAAGSLVSHVGLRPLSESKTQRSVDTGSSALEEQDDPKVGGCPGYESSEVAAMPESSAAPQTCVEGTVAKLALKFSAAISVFELEPIGPDLGRVVRGSDGRQFFSEYRGEIRNWVRSPRPLGP